MPRWVGPLSDEQARALHEVWKDLRARAPEGWSVVKGQNGLVIRPRERRLGKFSLIPSPDGSYYVAFYSQQQRRWTNAKDFAKNEDVVGAIMQWMVLIVAQ